jgi:hypothetical protein
MQENSVAAHVYTATLNCTSKRSLIPLTSVALLVLTLCISYFVELFSNEAVMLNGIQIN